MTYVSKKKLGLFKNKKFSLWKDTIKKWKEDTGQEIFATYISIEGLLFTIQVILGTTLRIFKIFIIRRASVLKRMFALIWPI